MATMNISIPDSMRAFVDTQVDQGGYMSASEYFRELVREQQLRQAQDKFDALVLEGLQSGPGIEMTPQYWDDVKADFLANRK